MQKKITGIVCLVILSSLFILAKTSAIELTVTQRNHIAFNCSSIIDRLKTVQKADAYMRTYLGDRYDAISANFVTPFNHRLLSNNFEETDSKSQSTLINEKKDFSNDFIEYQKALESLINSNICENDQEGFYEMLEGVREKREIVHQDTLKMQETIKEHMQFVNDLKASL